MVKITFEFDSVTTLEDMARVLMNPPNQAPKEKTGDPKSAYELACLLSQEEQRHMATDRELIRTQDSLLSVQNQLSDYQNQLSDYKDSVRDLVNKLDAANRKNAELANELDLLKAADKALSTYELETRKRIQQLNWDLESAKRVNDDLLALNEALRSDVGEANASFKTIVAHIINGKKISAIKSTRTFLDCGLKEAKDFVELLEKFEFQAALPKKEVDRLDRLVQDCAALPNYDYDEDRECDESCCNNVAGPRW